jgi:hypothetical protein
MMLKKRKKTIARNVSSSVYFAALPAAAEKFGYTQPFIAEAAQVAANEVLTANEVRTLGDFWTGNVLVSAPDGLSQKTAKPSRAVILQAFMNENVPRNETSIDRLQDEGTTIIFAGTETTARALSVMMFHVTNDPKHLVQLRAELDATSDPSLRDITVTALEKLPYLVRATSRTTISTPLTITIQTGVINEGLRLSHGPLIRLPRVATHDTLRYGNYRIPPGVSITRPLRSLSAKN